VAALRGENSGPPGYGSPGFCGFIKRLADRVVKVLK
jgi:hypothetical protein